MLFVLSPYDVLSQGLSYLGRKETDYNDKNIRLFKCLYGSNPIVIAKIWEDLQTFEEIAIPQKYKSDIGFHELMISIYFVWAYPKNANILGNSFGIYARRVQGGNLWRWIKRVALLKKTIMTINCRYQKKILNTKIKTNTTVNNNKKLFTRIELSLTFEDQQAIMRHHHHHHHCHYRVIVIIIIAWYQLLLLLLLL